MRRPVTPRDKALRAEMLDKAREARRLQAAKAALEEKRNALRAGLPHLFSYKWYPWSRALFESRAKVSLCVAANQVSKALDDTTEIPTPRGFRRMGELRVGDEVFGRDGRPVRIIDIPFKGRAECFRFTFKNGETVVASGDHEWVCRTGRDRFPRRGAEGGWRHLSTTEIVEAGQYAPDTSPIRRVTVPFCEPVRYSASPLRDPYLLGLLLGNAGMTHGSVVMTTAEPELVSYLWATCDAVPTGRFGYRLRGLAGWMRDLGLLGHGSHEKFIPRGYLEGRAVDRIWILRGLMDTDGTISGKCAVSYTTVSPRLKDGIVELVASLGGRTRVVRRKAGYRTREGIFKRCRDAYTIHVWTPFNPFHLKRKAERYYQICLRHERIIYSVEPVGSTPATCITVASPEGTFLATRDYIVTHNSSTQIRKTAHWSTATNLWPELWPGRTPRMFWYLYPSRDLAHLEWVTKWQPEFMPRPPFDKDPRYGYEVEFEKGKIHAVHWNSGIHLYFKTYMQQASTLQAGTCDAIFCDEELPEHLWDELIQRISATKGYFSMVFTPTLNQHTWWRAMECRGTDEEFLPDAFKLNVSKYDCLTYEDGTPGPWTREQIEAEEAACSTDAERQRRIYGRFVTEVGRKYPQYEPTRHYIAPRPIPDGWQWYVAIDKGGGKASSKNNHYSAIVFIAVRPDFRLGYVAKCWRGDGQELTSQDVLEKLREMRGDLAMTLQIYPHDAKDFGIIAARQGEGFVQADKSHARGEDVVNTLFKADMLFIFDSEEARKLSSELITLLKSTVKDAAKDDLADGLRYSTISIPWDWTFARKKLVEMESQKHLEVTPAAIAPSVDISALDDREIDRLRMRGLLPKKSASDTDMERDFHDEIEFWQSEYG